MARTISLILDIHVSLCTFRLLHQELETEPGNPLKMWLLQKSHLTVSAAMQGALRSYIHLTFNQRCLLVNGRTSQHLGRQRESNSITLQLFTLTAVSNDPLLSMIGYHY